MSAVDEGHSEFLCPHGEKDKNLCKECQGADGKGLDNNKTICKHGKLKYRCHPCGGRGVCEHGKRKTVRNNKAHDPPVPPFYLVLIHF